MKWIDYREKLGIGFNDKQRIEALKNKLTNFIDFLNRSSRFEYTYNDLMMFMTSIGERIDEDFYEELLEVRELLDNTKDEIDLISIYIEFCNCYNRLRKNTPNEDLFSFLCTAMKELEIQFEIFDDEDGKYIFPKGVEEFDSALVSAPLQWLIAYPNTEKGWSKALRDYAECKPDKASDIADKFRKALETFFKEFFGNDKTLENNKAEYGRYLKAQGVPAEISNNLETLLLAYTNFMNAYAKHHDKTEPKVLEYLMYQTGNIMRLLITLKAEETSNAD